MDNFSLAFDFLMKEEGGYVDDPYDPGGETKYGISKSQYPSVDIKNLTLEAAKNIYYRDYWLKAKCELMPFEIALSVFDFGVNSGLDDAIPVLQITMGVDVDGVIGPETIAAINKNKMLNYNTYRILYLVKLKKFDKYGRGWTGRVLRLVSFITLHGGNQ